MELESRDKLDIGCADRMGLGSLAGADSVSGVWSSGGRDECSGVDSRAVNAVARAALPPPLVVPGRPGAGVPRLAVWNAGVESGGLMWNSGKQLHTAERARSGLAR